MSDDDKALARSYEATVVQVDRQTIERLEKFTQVYVPTVNGKGEHDSGVLLQLVEFNGAEEPASPDFQ